MTLHTQQSAIEDASITAQVFETYKTSAKVMEEQTKHIG
jgi:hypothetical protein